MTSYEAITVPKVRVEAAHVRRAAKLIGGQRRHATAAKTGPTMPLKGSRIHIGASSMLLDFRRGLTRHLTFRATACLSALLVLIGCGDDPAAPATGTLVVNISGAPAGS